MNCTVPANQPIYQALIDKAASYPSDKPYQAKAYKKAAESIATYTKNIYDSIIEPIPGIGSSIEKFIDDFIYESIKANPQPATYAEKAMDEARKIAAQNAPTITIDQLRTALGLDTKPVEPAKPAWSYSSYLESLKPVIYTAESPRRSRRLATKPKVEYFTKEDEQDEIAEAIEAFCAKKGYEFSEDLVSEFNTWLSADEKRATKKYDWRSGKYIFMSKPETAKQWAMYYSTSLQEQQKLKKFSKAIVKYCEKNGFEYDPLMDEKFAAWKANPANKKLFTYTSYSCTCGICDPTGTKKPSATEYSYNRSPAYWANKWFSTLKKTVVL
jgi:hypothetical protein